ncbi:MAG: HDIG domain-containing protein [Bacteroidetes bacterium]|nr:HDIG domain-containing protein [Bacteroidota bacterium]
MTEHQPSRSDETQGIGSFLQNSMAMKITLAVVLVIVISQLFPKGLEYQYEYKEGDIWIQDDLIAPMAFSIYRDAAVVEEERRQAALNTPPSFDQAPEVECAVLDSLGRMLKLLQRDANNVADELSRRGRSARSNALADSLSRIAAQNPQYPVRLSSRQWRYWLTLWSDDNRTAQIRAIESVLQNSIRHIYGKGFLDREKDDFQQDVLAIRVDSTTEIRKPVKEFYDHREVAEVLQARFADHFGDDSAGREFLTALVYPLLKPNILYNNARTQFAIQAAMNNVMRTDGIVKENERIVSRHELITPEIKAKLDSYMRKKALDSDDGNQVLQFLGRIGHTIAILFLPVIYLSLFRKRIIGDNSRLLLISVIILLIAFLAYLTFTLPVSGPVQFLIIVPAAAMLLTVIFDSRVAFYTTVSISFLIGALRGNEYSIILASVVAGSLAIYTVRDIKNRTQIFRSLSFIFLGYAFIILVNGLERAIPFLDMAEAMAYALANSILSPVITFGLLIFFERVFRITTDLTLLELSDFNHPLLRDLSSRAPGTFHHSIVMGTLAEAAATAIGANATLARVGAYYHDIGKMLEPEYFVENQIGNQNIHDSLTPRDSARRIIDHVLRGIELAKEHNLPDRVIDFIPAHHGTTLVTYFYEKEKANSEGPVPPELYRYQGPKPYSKETGIVMLADTIEAATRAIDEPTIENIRELIERIVAKRLADGELENCDLTFRELSVVKQSFLNILTGIHHNRIKYPSEEEAAAAKKIAERTSKLLNLPSTTDALLQRIKKLDSF